MKKYLIIFICAVLHLSNARSQIDMTAVEQFINQSEYHIRWQETVQAYQSPNRMNNIRTSFYDHGVSLKPRVDSAYSEDWEIRYNPAGVYRNNAMVKSLAKMISPPTLDENRIIFDYDGLFIEYVNSREGLRQNFIVNEKPPGEGELILHIELNSNLDSKYDGGKIYFYETINTQNKQPILMYHDLRVWDANGTAVPASIQLNSANQLLIEIHVDDEYAQYPLTIDPLTSTPNWVLEANLKYTAVGDFNGDGLPDLLTGAPLYTNGQTNEGILKIHYGIPGGTFNITPEWIYESNILNLNMGDKIANAGDVNNDGFDDILIGCNFYDNVQSNEGICYMFLGSSTTPGTTPDWSVESNTSSAEFGNSVAAAGDINNDGYDDVVIGSYKHTTSGRVFIYHGNATGLSLTGTSISGTGSGNEFGFCVTGNKDLNADGYDDIVTTARYKYGTGEASSAGRVYVFNGSATGIATTPSWTYTAKQANAHLGNAAAISDINNDGHFDLVVSAIDYDTIGTDYGLVYVFMGTVAGFPASPTQLFLGTQTDEDLGTTITDLGDLNNDGYHEIAVGSPYHDGAYTTSGRIYLFHGTATSLNLNPAMIISYEEFSAYTGRSVSALGDTNGDGFDDFIAVNAVYNEPDIGSGLLYFGDAEMNLTFGLWNKNSTTAYYGNTIGHMDMNQDGEMDLMIGAPNFDGGSTDEGKLFVFWNNGGYFDLQPDWTVESQQAGSYFAGSLSSAGDVNGDGYIDIAVGAINFDAEETDDGAVIIYYGNAMHQPNEWMRQIVDGGEGYGNSNYGSAICGGGDINNDGFDDIIISAPSYNGPYTYEGIVHVYSGSSEGILDESLWNYSLTGSSHNTGNALVNANFNGDNYDDLLIASGGYDGLEGAEGRIDLFYGTATGFSTSPSWTVIGSDYWMDFGKHLAGGGDLNADGYADFIVSEEYYHYVNTDSLRFKLYFGSPTFPVYSGWHLDVKFYLGRGIGDIIYFDGDLNGDGYDEILFAEIKGENGQGDEGLVYCYQGGLYGPDDIPSLIENNIGLAYFGSALDIIPDMNDDGAGELFVGAPNQTTNYGQGIVYMYYGVPTECPSAEIMPAGIAETSADFLITGTSDVYYIKWKSVSATIWNLDSTNTGTYHLGSLVACSNYQIKVQSACAGDYSRWSDVLAFTSDCVPCTTSPTGLFADNITTSSAKLHWNLDVDATKYKIQYKNVGGSWTTINAIPNYKTISGLTPATNYQYKVKSICAGGLQSAYSPVSTFTTLPLRFENPQDISFMLFPNPANDQLFLVSNFEANELTITDQLGNIVLHISNKDFWELSIPVSGLASGLYYIHVRNHSTDDFALQMFVKL